MEYNQSAYTEIPLSQCKMAKVSIEDAARLSFHKWWVVKDRRQEYAMRWEHLGDDKRRRVFLHRAILGAKKGQQVDHANHDGLDNRRCNLRLATWQTNQMNSRKRRGTTSKFKGVSWKASHECWRARIVKDGKEHFLGHFSDERKAAAAYNKAAREMFGEFANPNQMDN